MASIPRGARLDEAAFRPRHLVLTVALVLHVPVLAGIGLVRGEGGVLLGGQLAVMAVAAVLVRVLARQGARASAVSLGLMVGADALVREIIEGVVSAQGTIAAAVEEQNAATAQAEQAMSGATEEAARMAAGLERMVSDDRARRSSRSTGGLRNGRGPGQSPDRGLRAG